VTEGHDDLGAIAAFSQEGDELLPKRRFRIRDDRGDSLRVEEHHARPAHRLATAVRGHEVHHEEIPLVFEGVLAVLELRERLAAEALEQLQMLFSPFERLLERDDAVAEHSGLGHVGGLGAL
jgi:hypothetical protein